MKSLYLILISTIFLIANANAQTRIFHGDRILTTQAQVDAFNYTSVTGDVIIHQSSVETITNLLGLSELTSVGNNLIIENNYFLNNLDGLSNLASIGGNLTILNNDNQDGGLYSLNGLSGLNTIGGDLTIQSNSNLVAFCGLYNLLSNNGLNGSYIVSNNGVNPTQQDIISGGSCPVGVHSGDLTITSQDQIDNFDYTIVTGTLQIKEQTPGNIVNLDGLSGLTQVNYLEIDDNNTLSGIDGLNNLVSVNSIDILNNASLTHISGFSNIDSLGGVLVIQSNPLLTVIDGFSNLNYIWGELRIVDNDALTNLDAFPNLNTVHVLLNISSDSSLTNFNGLSSLSSNLGTISITDNPLLTNIDVLSFIDNISGSIVIKNNSSLINLNGLSNLLYIGGHIEIKNNPALTNLEALSNLAYMGGYLDIEYNESLYDISGLSNILTIDGDLTIIVNPILNFCVLYDMLSNGRVFGTVVVANKNDELISKQDIITAGGCSNYIELNSQSEVDNFNYTSAVNLIISNVVDGNITNLDGLSELSSISGFFILSKNSALKNLNGLSGITSVGGKFEINNNNTLDTIKLSSLVSTGDLLIQGNNSLREITGLTNFISVTNDLEITYNGSLENINGFSQLNSVGRDLDINYNSALTNIDGLSNLNSIGRNLSIIQNFILTRFCGLYSLFNNNGLVGNYLVGYNAANPTAQEIINLGACEPLPVELINFSCTPIDNSVKLSWQTATEVNNYGFEIERKANDAQWVKLNFMPGYGNSNSPKQYEFVDKNLLEGNKFLYRLKQVDNDGSYKYSNEIEITLAQPKEFVLEQNYPNPFNPTTKIKYSIPVGTQRTVSVKLKVYDILGNEIAALVNKEQQPGNYEVEFDASNLSNGVYFYKLQSGKFLQTKKMLLLK